MLHDGMGSAMKKPTKLYLQIYALLECVAPHVVSPEVEGVMLWLQDPSQGRALRLGHPREVERR